MAPSRASSSSFASVRSAAVVTLRFVPGAGWMSTVPPARSTRNASSVASARLPASLACASRSASAWKTCGVWAAHRRSRSSVRSIVRASPTRLTVSVIGAAAMMPCGLRGARERGHESVDQLRRHQRSRGVMDTDDVGPGQGERGGDGLRPRAAAGDDLGLEPLGDERRDLALGPGRGGDHGPRDGCSRRRRRRGTRRPAAAPRARRGPWGRRLRASRRSRRPRSALWPAGSPGARWR